MTRFSLIFLLFFIGTHASKAQDFAAVKHVIDTHIHLYDTTRDIKVSWPPENDTVLYKPHLPAEMKKVSKPAGVTGAVIVEASDRLEDNGWVLDLVKGDVSDWWKWLMEFSVILQISTAMLQRKL